VSFLFTCAYSNRFKSRYFICSPCDSAAVLLSELEGVRLARQAFVCQTGAL